MKLLPVVLIPNINQNILKKPFYKYVLSDALKINNEIIVITNKKKLNCNFKSKEIKKFYLKKLYKKNIENILNKNLNYKKNKFKGFIIFNAKYPWRNSEIIKKGIKLFNTRKYDLVKSLSIAEENPFKMWFFNNGKLCTVSSLKNETESHSYPRQLLPITYIENGFFEIVGKSYFNKKKIKTKILNTHFPSLEINKNSIHDIEYLFKKEKINKKMFHTKKRLPS
tara:strand:+ start:423 stop:1094 length:672 start_codon:yes stop_codon:yes gene_type:complete